MSLNILFEKSGITLPLRIAAGYQFETGSIRGNKTGPVSNRTDWIELFDYRIQSAVWKASPIGSRRIKGVQFRPPREG